jgi:luciferase family oxidoreductase group 1
VSASKVVLSVLDVGLIRDGQADPDALAAMMSLASTAERCGYRRYWLAEHHNVPATIAASTPTTAAAIADRTGSIGVGGCVLIHNDAPLRIAEQFAVVEALHPSRVDVAIGAAAGTDGLTAQLLRGGSGEGSFDELLRQVQAFSSGQEVSVGFGAGASSGRLTIRPTPAPATHPRLWVWGTSAGDAQLAGELGLGYLHCYHILGRQGLENLDVYRRAFRAGPTFAEPQTAVSVIVVVGRSEHDAWELTVPHLRMMAQFRTGQLTTAQELARPLPASHSLADFGELAPMAEMFLQTWLVGDADRVADGVLDLAGETGCEEVFLNPIAASRAEDPLDRFPHREFALQALADRLQLASGAGEPSRMLPGEQR